MRTDIFANYKKLDKQFKDDLTLLWKLPQKRRMQILSLVPEMYNAHTTIDTQRCIERINDKLKGDTEENLKIINLLRNIYLKWNPAKDTPANFMKDMEELNLFPKVKKNEAKEFLLEFSSTIEKNNLTRLKQFFISSGMPSLSGFSIVGDYRPVIRNIYAYSDNKNVEDYNPKIVDFAPVFICSFSSDDQKSYSFQCSLESVEDLINQLCATKKELEVAKYAFIEKKGE